jgi:hypothetical protein
MALRSGVCESCGNRVAVPRLRRLFWARVCVECDRALRRRRVLADGDEGASAAGFALRGAEVRDAVTRIAAYGALVGLCWLIGDPFLRALNGALAADLMTWLLFALIMAPFQGIAFSLQFGARALALGLAAAVADAAFPEAFGSFGVEAAAGFFAVLFVKALWFGWFWTSVAHGDADPEDFDRF